jgi:hypothetical protein
MSVDDLAGTMWRTLCSGCAATMYQVQELLDNPPKVGPVRK